MATICNSYTVGAKSSVSLYCDICGNSMLAHLNQPPAYIESICGRPYPKPRADYRCGRCGEPENSHVKRRTI